MRALTKQIIKTACWLTLACAAAAVTYGETAWQMASPPAKLRLNVCGHYLENFGHHPSMLFLYPDHTFVHLFYLPHRRTYRVNQGHWHFGKRRVNDVWFSHFRFRAVAGHPGYWITGIMQSPHRRLEFWRHEGEPDFYLRRW